MSEKRKFNYQSVGRSAKMAQKACTFTQKKRWLNVRTFSHEYKSNRIAENIYAF